MSHRDQDEGQDLARFLATTAPADADALDADVREAVFALRPDLAPAPRLTADDILATVRTGPLADDASTSTPSSLVSRDGAEVVAFPGTTNDDEDASSAEEASDATVSDDTTKPPPSRRRWAIGTSGVGLLLAAAATLLLVSRPILQEAAQAPAESRSAAPGLEEERDSLQSLSDAPQPSKAPVVQAKPSTASTASTKTRLRERSGAADRIQAGRQSTSRQEPTPTARPAKPPLPPQPNEQLDLVGSGASSGEAYRDSQAIARGLPPADYARRPTPREVEKDDFAQQLQQAIPEVSAAGPGALSPTVVHDIDRLRAQANPTDRIPGAWRAGLTDARLAVIDEALASASAFRDAGDPALAAEQLARFTEAPPREQRSTWLRWRPPTSSPPSRHPGPSPSLDTPFRSDDSQPRSDRTCCTSWVSHSRPVEQHRLPSRHSPRRSAPTASASADPRAG